MEDFNELEWINDFFNDAIDLQIEGIERVRNFALFWNMFENYACRNFANVARIKDFVDELEEDIVSAELLNPYVEYFIERYTNHDNQIDIRGLLFRTNRSDSQAKEKVINVLSREETNPKETLEALLLIILRFRNNLFHGNKQIVNLNSQVENFAVANKLLANVLELMRLNQLIVL